ncbi:MULTISPECIES: ATP-binding protein [unclassified Achromobacter]|uniref:ATP-binding protein n=1 Tax=unclassified Achromobacter TaxID=2626865 RepID=UPI000B51B184|nr:MULTISPECIES: ATP-binding protein [unclassified Achromobacter]OWT71342.1 ATPase [Achromobacter sp. HZ34]OWT73307.1 ATPase [Achromobacter sp. HZ28]
MIHRLLTARIENDQALVRVRDRTRQVGDVFGMDNLQRTRLITAVSEIARNAVQHAGGGQIEFFFREESENAPQALIVRISDGGPGMNVAALPADGQRPNGKTMLGIAGSRRLVDHFDIESTPGKGTRVALEMQRSHTQPIIGRAELAPLMEQMARRKAQTPVEELEQQNREMLLTLEELRLRQTELEKADERKDEFLAMLAHELRNPLSAIGTALELLKRKRNASETDFQRLGDLMTRQTAQLTRLVNDLLDVSRVTRGKIDLTLTPVLLTDLIDHALESTHGIITARHHTLAYTPPVDAMWICADNLRFRQILGNLLHNAARYTPEHGRITIRVSREGQRVAIAVEDNGIGIGADMLPRVFDLFAQADTNLSRQDTGLGIGLTLVQRLLKLHRGSVEVHSEGLGKGSRFTVYMPLLEADAVADTPQAELAHDATRPVPRQPAQHRSGSRILLIDDNVDAVHTLRQLLEDGGHVVAEAHTGERGLAVAELFTPSVVVIDIGLPGIDGFQVAQEIRAQPSTSASLLVALSGYTSDAMRQRGREAGFDRYLTKPADIDALEEMIRDR